MSEHHLTSIVNETKRTNDILKSLGFIFIGYSTIRIALYLYKNKNKFN